MTISPLADVTQGTETAAPASRNPANKETFLQLLVAQIKNQNPLSPADGVQFLTQLAQFSELEQMLEIRNEISALRTQLTEKESTSTESNETKTTGA
jgi:flagellar basal-body rod modification protein FlgD